MQYHIQMDFKPQRGKRERGGRQIGKNGFTRPLDQEGGPSSLTQITYTSQHFSGETRISGTAQQKMGKDMVRITKERQVLENGP